MISGRSLTPRPMRERSTVFLARSVHCGWAASSSISGEAGWKFLRRRRATHISGAHVREATASMAIALPELHRQPSGTDDQTGRSQPSVRGCLYVPCVIGANHGLGINRTIPSPQAARPCPSRAGMGMSSPSRGGGGPQGWIILRMSWARYLADGSFKARH